MILQRKLIDGWQTAHHWGSMRFKAAAAGLAAIQAGWPDIPSGYKAALPQSVPHYLALATIASVGLAAYSQITTKATKTPTP